MARNGNRVWRVEVQETRDWTAVVREADLDLPPDASDDAIEEAVAEHATRMVADQHRDATLHDATREAGRVEPHA